MPKLNQLKTTKTSWNTPIWFEVFFTEHLSFNIHPRFSPVIDIISPPLMSQKKFIWVWLSTQIHENQDTGPGPWPELTVDQ